MQVQSYKPYNYPIQNKSEILAFKGFHSKDAKALLALDLDGTFAKGSQEHVNRVLELAKKANATVVYATGRNLKEVTKLIGELKLGGVDLPLPSYLITNNGQFVFKNIAGELVEDTKWRDAVKKKTGFDRSTVYKTIHEIAHTPEYKYSQEELEKLQHLDDFKLRKQEDPDFWDSKISYYEWNPSVHMLEYFLDSGIQVDKLQRTIADELKIREIKTKFILNRYPKKIMDACSDKIIRQSRPLREDKFGAMTAMFCCPANKADGVRYLRDRLKISNDEILMAGNERNDISMANMTKHGAFFTCVANASEDFKEYLLKIKQEPSNKFSKNLIMSKKPGALGIVEGMEKILKKFRPDLEI